MYHLLRITVHKHVNYRLKIGKGREKEERVREEKNSLYVCHSLALLFQLCLILKMIHLSGISRNFRPNRLK